MGKGKDKSPVISQDANQNSETNDGGGYRKPPKHSRFKPGKSGNSRGRPPGAKGRKGIVEKIANEMHWITENGKRCRRSTHELVLLIIRNKSIEGNRKAFRALHKRLKKCGPQETSKGLGFLVVPEQLSDEEWSKAAQVQQQQSKARSKQLYNEYMKSRSKD